MIKFINQPDNTDYYGKNVELTYKDTDGLDLNDLLEMFKTFLYSLTFSSKSVESIVIDHDDIIKDCEDGKVCIVDKAEYNKLLDENDEEKE